MVTQGSDARSKLPPLAGVPPLQRAIGAEVRVHVPPPSNVNAVTGPREPPPDQRSCCHAPMKWLGLAGSTAMEGSASALRYTVPAADTPSQPGAKVVRPDGRVNASTRTSRGEHMATASGP